MKAGASSALAADIDPFALCAVTLNGGLNDVALDMTGEDLLDHRPPQFECILVGDLFYERNTAERLMGWLEQAARHADILIGDPGRSYLPTGRLDQVATYDVPVTRDLGMPRSSARRCGA